LPCGPPSPRRRPIDLTGLLTQPLGINIEPGMATLKNQAGLFDLQRDILGGSIVVLFSVPGQIPRGRVCKLIAGPLGPPVQHGSMLSSIRVVGQTVGQVFAPLLISSRHSMSRINSIRTLLVRLRRFGAAIADPTAGLSDGCLLLGPCVSREGSACARPRLTRDRLWSGSQAYGPRSLTVTIHSPAPGENSELRNASSYRSYVLCPKCHSPPTISPLPAVSSRSPPRTHVPEGIQCSQLAEPPVMVSACNPVLANVIVWGFGTRVSRLPHAWHSHHS